MVKETPDGYGPRRDEAAERARDPTDGLQGSEGATARTNDETGWRPE